MAVDDRHLEMLWQDLLYLHQQITGLTARELARQHQRERLNRNEDPDCVAVKHDVPESEVVAPHNASAARVVAESVRLKARIAVHAPVLVACLYGWHYLAEIRKTGTELDQRMHAAGVLQQANKNHQKRRRVAKATRIQAGYRGWSCRRKIRRAALEGGEDAGLARAAASIGRSRDRWNSLRSMELSPITIDDAIDAAAADGDRDDDAAPPLLPPHVNSRYDRLSPSRFTPLPSPAANSPAHAKASSNEGKALEPNMEGLLANMEGGTPQPAEPAPVLSSIFGSSEYFKDLDVEVPLQRPRQRISKAVAAANAAAAVKAAAEAKAKAEAASAKAAAEAEAAATKAEAEGAAAKEKAKAEAEAGAAKATAEAEAADAEAAAAEAKAKAEAEVEAEAAAKAVAEADAAAAEAEAAAAETLAAEAAKAAEIEAAAEVEEAAVAGARNENFEAPQFGNENFEATQFGNENFEAPQFGNENFEATQFGVQFGVQSPEAREASEAPEASEASEAPEASEASVAPGAPEISLGVAAAAAAAPEELSDWVHFVQDDEHSEVALEATMAELRARESALEETMDEDLAEEMTGDVQLAEQEAPAEAVAEVDADAEP